MRAQTIRRVFRRARPEMEAGRALYAHAVEQARSPAFYTVLDVPDSLDGRFDAIVLHAVLLIRRLHRASPPLAERGQAIFDALVEDMDNSVRELGAGDLGVAPRVKRMAQGFYGRYQAYEAALDGDEDLRRALARNLYGTVNEPEPARIEAMASYVTRESERLEELAATEFDGRKAVFGPPPSAIAGELESSD